MSKDLFIQRMQSEGRLGLFQERVAKLVADGLARTKKEAEWMTMRKMGYQGPKLEKALAPGVSAKIKEKEAEVKVGADIAKLDEAIGNGDYLKAYNSLPNAAQAEEEMTWISSHPLMDIALITEEPPKITADDILNPSNGKAPSKAAVLGLRRWLRDPDAFYSELLKETRKKTGQGELGAKGDVDPQVSEIHRMLKELETV
jgi:hypothetical protein